MNPFKLPDPPELRALADELRLDLSSKELANMHDWLQPFAQGYAFLDTQPEVLPEVLPPERSYRTPASGENSLGAWYIRSEISSGATGPLQGWRVAIKDNICVAGIPMMDGAGFLEGLVPDFDATVVTRLLAAGAEIAGKSVCEFLCLSGGSATSSNGPVENPHKPGYSTGGSSSGSAALVATGAVDLALGTDQGGSVRIPASWTGVCGMKATLGVVPYTGGVPMETSIDHIGPLTASVEKNALALEVLAGRFADEQAFPVAFDREYSAGLGAPISGMRLAVVKEGFAHPLSEPEVDDCVQAAVARLQQAGAKASEVAIPDHLHGPGIWGAVVTDGFWRTLTLNGLGYNYDGVYSPALFQAMGNWREKLAAAPINVKLLLLLGRYMERYNNRYYGKAKNHVRALRAAYDKVLSEYDLLIMPTTVQKAGPNPAPDSADYEQRIIAQAFDNTLNTGQFNATGHPAMSIPCGMRDGLPVGLMLVGRFFDEARIYQVAFALQKSRDWRQL